MTTTLVGPYIGSFEHELISNIPYARYLSDIFDGEVYVSGYSNRMFMYDWLIDDRKIPVNEMWARNDEGQVGYINSDVSLLQYQQESKRIKQHVLDKTRLQPKDIDTYSLTYQRGNQSYSINQRTYQKINNIRLIPKLKESVIFIPDNSLSEEDSLNIYNSLIPYYNVLVIGDCKTRLNDTNILMHRLDYVDKVYEMIYSYIESVKFVVTPCSYWTILCNMQQVPVVSWGKNIGIYKSNGIFGFDNKNLIISSPKTINSDVLLKSIEYFQSKL